MGAVLSPTQFHLRSRFTIYLDNKVPWFKGKLEEARSEIPPIILGQTMSAATSIDSEVLMFVRVTENKVNYSNDLVTESQNIGKNV